jgi:hypothetical protein
MKPQRKQQGSFKLKFNFQFQITGNLELLIASYLSRVAKNVYLLERNIDGQNWDETARDALKNNNWYLQSRVERAKMVPQRLSCDYFLPDPFQFFIYQSPYHSVLYAC